MSEREFDAYLKLLGGLLQLAPSQREQIAVELRDHMEDRLEALLAAGVPRDKAIGQALEEFGDVAALAASFRQIAWNRKRRWIMRCTIASVLGMLGIILAAAALWPGGSTGPGVLAQAQAQSNEEALTGDLNSQDARSALTRERLSQMTTANFTDVPLGAVLPMVFNQLGIQYYLDRAEIEMNGIDLEENTVTLEMDDVRCSMLLDIVLSPLDCGYYLRDGFVCVTSHDKAMSMAELRVYDCWSILDAVAVNTSKVSRSANRLW
ncbi:MAG: permease prefix domain 1-containing protein [Pirellulales bacterium]|nr:permease prefix domain 1-containing protein [Pirellulales bacterium]